MQSISCNLAGAAGIEPALVALEATVLPLNYAPVEKSLSQ